MNVCIIFVSNFTFVSLIQRLRQNFLFQLTFTNKKSDNGYYCKNKYAVVKMRCDQFDR